MLRQVKDQTPPNPLNNSILFFFKKKKKDPPQPSKINVYDIQSFALLKKKSSMTAIVQAYLFFFWLSSFQPHFLKQNDKVKNSAKMGKQLKPGYIPCSHLSRVMRIKL